MRFPRLDEPRRYFVDDSKKALAHDTRTKQEQVQANLAESYLSMVHY
jgi:hypothetical protein